MFLNYYDILGITSSANAGEIKKAFRIKAKQYHPDVNNANDAPEKFRLVNEAYEVLIDTQRRYLFDLKLDSMRGKVKRPPQARARQTYTYSSVKADPNFHYDWGSISRAAAHNRKESPLVANNFMYHLLFVIGLFMGCIVIAITVWAISNGYWPAYSAFAAIPGVFMVREGWRGIMGHKTWLSDLLKKKFKA